MDGDIGVNFVPFTDRCENVRAFHQIVDVELVMSQDINAFRRNFDANVRD